MRYSPRQIVGTMVDRRTAPDRANDELAESLLKCGDATTVAIVIRFIDQMRDIADRVLVRDYSAERLLSVGWPQSWMRPRLGLACAFRNRRWCSQFRIGCWRINYGCSDNSRTGIYALRERRLLRVSIRPRGTF
jgi:hypothetical protein